MKKLLILLTMMSLVLPAAMASEICIPQQNDYKVTCNSEFGCHVKIWYGSKYTVATSPILVKENHFWSLRWLPTFISHGDRLIAEWDMKNGDTEKVNWPAGYSLEMCAYIPTVIVNNVNSPEGLFETSGIGWNYYEHSCGYNGDYYYESNTDLTLKTKWTPIIEKAGHYDVYVHYCVHSARPTAVPYKVVYNGGESTVTVDQTKNSIGASGDFLPSGWFKLGTYKFAKGATGYIQLDTSSTGDTCADAVKLVGVV